MPEQQISFFGVKLIEWLTVFAILIGPCIGAWLAGYIEDIRAGRSAKRTAFATLLALKKSPLDARRVEAINLVPLLFYNKKDILSAWRNYIDACNFASSEDEKIASVNVSKMDQRFDELIFEIAKDIKINIEQKDIMKNHYMPQGWVNSWQMTVEKEQADKRMREEIATLGAIPVIIKQK